MNWPFNGGVPGLFLTGKPVPYKHSEDRHEFEKPHCKVTNWPAYNAALKRRGDLTVWFAEAALFISGVARFAGAFEALDQ